MAKPTLRQSNLFSHFKPEQPLPQFDNQTKELCFYCDRVACVFWGKHCDTPNEAEISSLSCDSERCLDYHRWGKWKQLARKAV